MNVAFATSFRTSIAAVGCAVLLTWAATADLAQAADAKCFVADWALTLPNGAAGWLGIEQKDGKLEGSLLWGGGSVLPVASVAIEGDQLIVKRIREGKRKERDGTLVTFQIVQVLTGKVDGDTLNLTTVEVNDKGKQSGQGELSGKRIPPLPPAPDLSKVEFGPPLSLFNGRDLTGWKLVKDDLPSGWTVENGILVNRAPQEEGKPHKRYANLRTELEFEDFNLTLETRVPPAGNSGIYLRGIYEIQVSDSFGKPLDAHNMGGIYSRTCPTVAAEKPAGEWQAYDITLVNRHITVILNGQKIIDNQPVRGCTGGALWSDEFRPGPIFLQGDHTSVDYRNIVLRAVVK